MVSVSCLLVTLVWISSVWVHCQATLLQATQVLDTSDLASLTVEIDTILSKVTITMTVDSSVWVGTGFGKSEMSDTYAIVASGGVEERILLSSSQGWQARGSTISPGSLTLVSDSTEFTQINDEYKSLRTVVVTRDTYVGPIYHDFSAIFQDGQQLPCIYAIGSTRSFYNHKTRGDFKLTFQEIQVADPETVAPSNSPTSLPSNTPSNSPSSSPTLHPSLHPSIPSSAPSTQPTVSNVSTSLSPTDQPSDPKLPTLAPTIITTSTTTSSPSSSPSVSPSFEPSASPTLTEDSDNSDEDSEDAEFGQSRELAWVIFYSGADAKYYLHARVAWHDDDSIQLDLTGPASQWMGFGFGSTLMSGTYAVIVDGTGAVTQRILGNGYEGVLLEDLDASDWSVLVNEVFGDTRRIRLRQYLDDIVFEGFDGLDTKDENQEMMFIMASSEETQMLGHDWYHYGSERIVIEEIDDLIDESQEGTLDDILGETDNDDDEDSEQSENGKNAATGLAGCGLVALVTWGVIVVTL